MATLYFYHASDTSYSTVGNWWTDAIHTAANGALPLSTDSIVIDSTVNQSSYPATVVNMTNAGFDMTMILTVSGTATFNSTAKNKGVVNGTCIFNATSENYAGANVVGGCTFNTSAKNYGTVTGTTIFNNASTNESGGVIQGGCTFNSTASNKAGATVTGATTFNSSSTCAGSVNGACTFNSSASVTSAGNITGACAFNGASILGGTVTGSCTFLDTASVSSTGVINGGASVASFEGTGTCAGTLTLLEATFESGSGLTSAGNVTATGTVTFYSSNAGDVDGDGECVFVSTSNTGTVIMPTCSFFGASTNHSTGTVTCTGECVFYTGSTNDGTVTCPSVTFDNTSTNTGTVNSNDCKINNDAGNSGGVIVGVGNFYGATGTGIYSDNTGGTVTGTLNAYWPATYPIGGTVTVSTNYYGYAFLQGQAQVGVRGIVDTLGIQDTVSLGNITGVIGLTAYGKMNVPVTLSRALCKSGVKGTLRLTTADSGFTVKQALAAIFSIWGAGCSDGCDAAYTAKGSAALDILNGCMQEILLNSKELQYLSRETITVSDTASDAVNGLVYYTLPENVQAVVGPVIITEENGVGVDTYNKFHAVGVATKSQLMNFSTYYNTPGKQIVFGYWIDRAYQLDGERTRIRIYTTATNEAQGPIYVDVEREALRYRAADCASGTVIPLPHQYAESLLLPLLREAASASPYASRRDSAPMYQASAASARKMFKLADPQNPSLTPKPERAIKP